MGKGKKPCHRQRAARQQESSTQEQCSSDIPSDSFFLVKFVQAFLNFQSLSSLGGARQTGPRSTGCLRSECFQFLSKDCVLRGFVRWRSRNLLKSLTDRFLLLQGFNCLPFQTCSTCLRFCTCQTYGFKKQKCGRRYLVSSTHNYFFDLHLILGWIGLLNVYGLK